MSNTMHTGEETYYDILQVHRDANSKQIRRAYRAACRQWHPDKNPAPAATQKFQQIRAAYDVLSNGLSRVQYDLALDIQELGLSFNKPDPADVEVRNFPDDNLASSGGAPGAQPGGFEPGVPTKKAAAESQGTAEKSTKAHSSDAVPAKPREDAPRFATTPAATAERPKSADAASRSSAVSKLGDTKALREEVRQLKAYRRVQDAMIKRERILRKAAERKLDRLNQELKDIRAAVERAASGFGSVPAGLFDEDSDSDPGGKVSDAASGTSSDAQLESPASDQNESFDDVEESDEYDDASTPLAKDKRHQYKSPKHVLVDHKEQKKFLQFQRKKIKTGPATKSTSSQNKDASSQRQLMTHHQAWRSVREQQALQRKQRRDLLDKVADGDEEGRQALDVTLPARLTLSEAQTFAGTSFTDTSPPFSSNRSATIFRLLIDPLLLLVQVNGRRTPQQCSRRKWMMRGPLVERNSSKAAGGSSMHCSPSLKSWQKLRRPAVPHCSNGWTLTTSNLFMNSKRSVRTETSSL